MKTNEFWVAEILPENGKAPFLAAYKSKPEQDKWLGWSVHVIEKSAYDQLKSDLALAVSCLEKYADKDFYCLYEDINWDDNWIAERDCPNRISKVGGTAKRLLTKLKDRGRE